MAEESAKSSDNPSSEDDTTNMFESVWVKVEVEEGEGEYKPSDSDSDTKRPTLESTRKKRKYTKVLKCDTCEYTTVYKNCLDLHILGHSDTKPYSCKFCNFKTKLPTTLQRHISGQHNVGKPLNLRRHKCDKCEYTTTYKCNLKSHLRKHEKDKKFKCSFCDYTTAYQHNLLKHAKKHRESTTYKCDKCPFETKFEGHITRHLAKIHNEVIEAAHRCSFCDLATLHRWRLTIHLQRSKQAQMLKCSYCEFETEYKCEYKRHKFVHIDKIKKSLQNTEAAVESKPESDNKTAFFDDDDDDECGDSFLKSKKRKHTDAEAYEIVPDCIDFKNLQVLVSDDKTKPFQCHLCTYSSRFKASVQRHFQRLHTGNQNRPYKCVNCDFSTKTKDQIALHNKRSKLEAPMKCKECSFSTLFKCVYVMHQKIHYTHKCDGCDYICRNKYELQQHYTSFHSGIKLKCQFCDYEASRKDSIRRHEATHTGYKPYKCEYCSYRAIRKCFVDNHKKKNHSDVQSLVTVVSNDRIDALRTLDEKAQESNLTGFEGVLQD